MRVLEWALMGTLAIQCLVLVTERAKPAAHPLILVGFVALLSQVVFEGYRWQLVPAWMLMVICTGGLVLLGRRAGRNNVKTAWQRRALRASLMLVAWAICVSFPLFMPVFELPSPSGRYAVGSTWLEIVDGTRSEVFTPDPDDARRLMVRVFYPAEAVEGRQVAPYWSNAVEFSRVMARSWHMPDYMFRHLRLVRTHSYPGAPVATGCFPVVTFSHGLTMGYPSQNTPLVEELASRGFVVFAIGHTYQCLGLRFPDGRFISYDPELQSEFKEEIGAFRSAHQSILSSLIDVPEDDRFASLYGLTPAISRDVAIWASDISTVIDEIETMAADASPGDLGSVLDPNRVAALGMSFGGAAAVECALTDARVDAIVNLDGFHYGRVLLGESPRQPMLLFSSETARRWRNQFVLERSSTAGRWVMVNGAKHFDFSDFSFFGNLFRWLGPLGDRSGPEMAAMISTFTVEFLAGQQGRPGSNQSHGRDRFDVEVRDFQPQNSGQESGTAQRWPAFKEP